MYPHMLHIEKIGDDCQGEIMSWKRCLKQYSDNYIWQVWQSVHKPKGN